jgi:hypothetical protein
MSAWIGNGVIGNDTVVCIGGATRHNVPDDSILSSHCHESLQSYTSILQNYWPMPLYQGIQCHKHFTHKVAIKTFRQYCTDTI